jgi:hypothetical protein
MNAFSEFGELDCAAVAALVLELASQLHVERARRLALEAALSDRGVLEAGQIEAAAEKPTLRAAAARGADEAVRRLLRILTESSNEQAPLRAEAPRSEGEVP